MRRTPERRGGLFLDRDGTLIVDKGYLATPDGVRLAPGVRRALLMARRTHRLFVFSNQSGISRGYFGWDAVDAVNARMLELLRLPAPAFDDLCMAAEHPDIPPQYRKPSPRFILESLSAFGLDPEQSWMVGDRLSDLQSGQRAGIRSSLIATGPLPADLEDYVRRHRMPVHPSVLAFVRAELKGGR